jgi:hypothetical protein
MEHNCFDYLSSHPMVESLRDRAVQAQERARELLLENIVLREKLDEQTQD